MISSDKIRNNGIVFSEQNKTDWVSDFEPHEETM